MHPRRDQTISISLRIGVYHPNTRTHGRLLGPCFKTGRISPVGRIMAAGHLAVQATTHSSTRGPPCACRGAKPVARRVAGPETILRRRGEKSPTPGQTDSLASNNFTYSFTFFPKFFSSFPHGTCSLSVSRKYLALEGHYLLISAAVPSNTTHDGRQLLRGESDSTGLLPSATRYLNDELHPSPRKCPTARLQGDRQRRQLFILSWSHFTRRYWGNPS